MRTIRIKLYKFSELSKEVQQTAIEKLWDINVMESYWYESIYEDAANIGLNITGFDLDRNYCNGEFATSAGEVVESILEQHGKDCESYKTALRYKNSFQNTSDEVPANELDDTEDNFLNEILEDYRIILSNEYKYMTSKVAIIETIESNEYEFTKDGKLA